MERKWYDVQSLKTPTSDEQAKAIRDRIAEKGWTFIGCQSGVHFIFEVNYESEDQLPKMGDFKDAALVGVPVDFWRPSQSKRRFDVQSTSNPTSDEQAKAIRDRIAEKGWTFLGEKDGHTIVEVTYESEDELPKNNALPNAVVMRVPDDYTLPA